jgi:putative membrane protein
MSLDPGIHHMTNAFFTFGPPGFALWGVVSAALHLLFWVVVIFLAVRLFRHVADRPPRSSGLTILEERYARGEIDQDEFLSRRAVILGHDTTPPQARSA